MNEAELIAVHAGDTVYFGAWPQTAAGNDRTPVAWRVLRTEGGTALLLSRYCLDCLPFRELRDRTQWEDSPLRVWLNEMFFRAAFSEEEQNAVLPAEGAPKDKVTVPDKSLAARLSGANGSRSDAVLRAVSTPYALSRGAGISGLPTVEGEDASYWWMTDLPGQYPGSTEDGYIADTAAYTPGCGVGIRPMIRIDLRAAALPPVSREAPGKDLLPRREDAQAADPGISTGFDEAERQRGVFLIARRPDGGSVSAEYLEEYGLFRREWLRFRAKDGLEKRICVADTEKEQEDSAVSLSSGPNYTAALTEKRLLVFLWNGTDEPGLLAETNLGSLAAACGLPERKIPADPCGVSAGTEFTGVDACTVPEAFLLDYEVREDIPPASKTQARKHPQPPVVKRGTLLLDIWKVLYVSCADRGQLSSREGG